MLCVFAVVADEELAAASVFACMCHGEHASVVILLGGFSLTFDMPAGTTRPHAGVTWVAAIGTAALYDKSRNYSVESKSIIKTVISQFYKICHRTRNFFVIEFRRHGAFGCFYYSSHIKYSVFN
jgi:hypothetical protein